MTKGRTRKTTPEPEGMDPSAPETKTPPTGEVGGMSNTARVAYAIKQLVKEVEELFPETPVTYGNINGRNTALSVEFDLTSLDKSEREALTNLAGLVESDPRVLDVLPLSESVLITLRANPVTQDSREPFGLADALHVLADPDDEDEQEPLFMLEPTAGWDEDESA